MEPNPFFGPQAEEGVAPFFPGPTVPGVGPEIGVAPPMSPWEIVKSLLGFNIEPGDPETGMKRFAGGLGLATGLVPPVGGTVRAASATGVPARVLREAAGRYLRGISGESPRPFSALSRLDPAGPDVSIPALAKAFMAGSDPDPISQVVMLREAMKQHTDNPGLVGLDHYMTSMEDLAGGTHPLVQAARVLFYNLGKGAMQRFVPTRLAERIESKAFESNLPLISGLSPRTFTQGSPPTPSSLYWGLRPMWESENLFKNRPPGPMSSTTLSADPAQVMDDLVTLFYPYTDMAKETFESLGTNPFSDVVKSLNVDPSKFGPLPAASFTQAEKWKELTKTWKQIDDY